MLVKTILLHQKILKQQADAGIQPASACLVFFVFVLRYKIDLFMCQNHKDRALQLSDGKRSLS